MRLRRLPRLLPLLLCLLGDSCKEDSGRERRQANLPVDLTGFLATGCDGTPVFLCAPGSTLARKSDFLHKQGGLGKQNMSTILFAKSEFCGRTRQEALTESTSVFHLSAAARGANAVRRLKSGRNGLSGSFLGTGQMWEHLIYRRDWRIYVQCVWFLVELCGMVGFWGEHVSFTTSWTCQEGADIYGHGFPPPP